MSPTPLIISASYRTDIPAFHGEWFLRRLAAGRVRVANPYGGPPSEVPLGPGAVAGFVLWTRNLKPLMGELPAVRARAPFTVQFTLTGYPRALETALIEAPAAVAQIQALRRDWGLRTAVWRYDPILVSSLTPLDWHRRNFAELAAALAGSVDEVVVSFLDLYRKTARNLAAAAKRHSFTWRDPELDEKRALIVELADIAARHGMRLSLCTEPALAGDGAEPARCIDAERLSDVAQCPILAPEQGTRPGCLCARSRDIGAYDTCAHGCVYCYAVESRAKAVKRIKARDVAGDSLGLVRAPPEASPSPSSG